jgi:tetratricopeptide (TPR) repeat protein
MNLFYMGRLASLAARQQRFADAEQLYQKIPALQRKELGFENPATLSDLAELFHLAKDYPKSEAVYRRVIESKSLEPGSGVILGSTERLGTVYEEQGKFEQAEALYRNAVGTNQLILPHGHLTTIANLNDLGLFYERRERLPEAETYYRRALEQFDGLSPDAGLMDSNLAIVTKNYAGLLRKEGRLNESEQYESRVKTTEDKLAPSRPDKVDLSFRGKVFRSDSNEAISNSYVQLENPRMGHFDTRTDMKGEYLFTEILPGDYMVSIYAWFRNKSDVPCQNPLESKTVDDGKVTVEWQWKSGAFMEIVTIKGFSVDSGQQRDKDFDLSCK